MKRFALNLNEITNLDNFSGIIPLFPLSTVVLFPHTLLPLHIFESRYKQMIMDVAEQEKIIGMALLKPGWEKGYLGNPEVFDVMGMGRIVNIAPLEEGRYNIVLYGLRRVKVVEMVKETPYRAARVEILRDEHCMNEPQLRQKVIHLVSAWNDLLGPDRESFKINIDPSLPLEYLLDVIASTQLSNVFEKQNLLQEMSLRKRAEKVIEHIETKFEVVSIIKHRRKAILEKRSQN